MAYYHLQETLLPSVPKNTKSGICIKNIQKLFIIYRGNYTLSGLCMKRHLQNEGSPIITIENLVKSFDETIVLHDISLTIHRGDMVSIIGPAGCGKSTLLRCLNCLEILDSGSITINGIRLARTNKKQPISKEFSGNAHLLRQQIGMVFQSYNLFPHKTVVDNVMLAPIVVQGLNAEQAREKAMIFLDKVGLSKFADRLPDSLSGGQKQRAAIARALAMSPSVMLYDEPTSALDPELVGEVLDVMRGLDRENMTQVVVTHEMQFAREASDYIVFMDKGELVEIIEEDAHFENPNDERVRRFLKRVQRK